MKFGLLAAALCVFLAPTASADLVIFGVIDGDLSGGLPKGIVLSATADVADLSIYGVGSANNGGGSDGNEFLLSGSALAGDKLVIANGTVSFDFFNDNYNGLLLFTDGAANINGDDAIELFQNDVVLDTYGDINVNGDGESWDYTNGYAVRIGGTAGAFEQANYNSALGVLVGLDEAAQASIIGNAFGFSAVPEPSSLAILSVLGLATCSVRRRSRS
jgi:hypothetical protein